MSVTYPSEGSPVSLAELAAASDLVVVGSTGDNVCRPTGDGRMVITLYEVSVETMLKGAVASGGKVSMILLGGQVRFPDGSRARVDTPGFWRPTQPSRRLFFLHEAAHHLVVGNEGYLSDGRAFVPTAGPLGIYDLSAPRGIFVNPAGHYTTPLGVSIRKAKLTPDAFIREVRTSISAGKE
jgi:hypothetical protein